MKTKSAPERRRKKPGNIASQVMADSAASVSFPICSLYKHNTLHRRIQRRIGIHQINPVVQKKRIPPFHYSLGPDGLLFLGGAETIGGFTDLLAPLSGKTRIYRRTAASLLLEPIELRHPELAEEAREVLRTLAATEKPISARDGRWFTVRIMPYRTLDDRIDGVVITFTDITTAKILEAELRQTQPGLEKRVADQATKRDHEAGGSKQ